MITLTEKAAAKVRDLQEENGQEGNLLRIFVESGGCSGFQYGMSFDAKKDGDSVLESAGVSFLMDDASLAYMDGSEIDFDDGLQGKGFEIKNPNAESTCGCGKSFS
ncbi:MAG: iron-sulfur cluster assembly accessory protein [Opitutales bacterium TMED158]|nr:MAG: iron-sulfur cluster assembly accessory protein [Opitutales bacterium TMED158]